ncbi:hypothetical protein EST38_g3446 [Candolleomyces aberdarensis]|uniref:Nephrocystin 3-like N-terminal domain-containing protein n=1 Tax=Candolleomyces aberdarensis TaxID=2316362 RepID=A0A4Q2DQJ0_9AGAR|nr:hypothetical protein EST38_g3446 [Candolleomyces aberdarensis]
MPAQSTYFDGAHHFRIDQQTINSFAGNQYQILNVREDLNLRLNPIPDASHTRDRKTSPPDSACFPGTREGVITEVTTWANAVDLAPRTEEGKIENTVSALVIYTPTPHVYWLHGFAGCGKSAVSLKLADIFEQSGRFLASYFFFRNAGDRSTMKRFAVTLASQLASALPATVPFIEAALRTDPGLLSNCVSLTRQLERLVYKPFQAVMKGELLEKALAEGPFIIVIDGLDECEDRRGVEEFINHMLGFFDEHPTIPLRVFIASRVEQHIQACLETDGVFLGNLDSHSARDDIHKSVRESFQTVAKKDCVIRAYIRARGAWPMWYDLYKLVSHIDGSFVLASTIFKYIVQPATVEDPLTPMDRLPLTLEVTGLDGLYAQTLARSQHLPHFRNIISTIALLKRPLSIVEIADLLGIQAFEVVGVLLNLQAIIHVPGTDEKGEVTVCHTSLRDFLTTERRSGTFFVPPSFHLSLSYYSVSFIFREGNGPARYYGKAYFVHHWEPFTSSEAYDFIDEIEQFKVRQPLLMDRLPYHAFLCGMIFYNLHLRTPRILVDNLHLLTECAKQLALAIECPDRHMRLWLETGMGYMTWDEDDSYTVQFTEDTYKTLQRDLQRASTVNHANFPDMIDPQSRLYGKEDKYTITLDNPSGIVIFNALEWKLAHARLKWEELKITPRPPLELYVFHYWEAWNCPTFGRSFVLYLDHGANTKRLPKPLRISGGTTSSHSISYPPVAP